MAKKREDCDHNFKVQKNKKPISKHVIQHQDITYCTKCKMVLGTNTWHEFANKEK